MNKLILSLVLSLTACAHASAPATPHVEENLAVDFAHRADRGAFCLPYYTASGPEKVHSALCEMSDHEIRYYAISNTRGPNVRTLMPGQAATRAAPDLVLPPQSPAVAPPVAPSPIDPRNEPHVVPPPTSNK